MLFNEPKLLKSKPLGLAAAYTEVSVLFNEPKLLKFVRPPVPPAGGRGVSVLFNEPKLLKLDDVDARGFAFRVSVLFNEPKLLKSLSQCGD